MRSLSIAMLLFAITAPPVLAGGGPENVLVLANDASSESLAIAHYYMHRRDIPRHHIVHISLQPRQWKTLPTYSDYKSLLEDPIRAWRKANPEALITTIVLTRDVPLAAPMDLPKDFKPYKHPRTGKMVKRPPDFYKGTPHLLATMDATRPNCRDAVIASVHGIQRGLWQTSPYYRAQQSIDPRTPAAADMPLFCVGLLNAFSVADVKRCIDNSLDSEGAKKGGGVYLGRSKQGDPRGCYNGAFPGLERALKANKFKAQIVPWDKSAELLTEKHDVLFYMFGQAKWQETFPAKNTYLAGAVVDNLTSYALSTSCFDEKGKHGQTSMCHFLRAGASAVHGCVREPYTAAFDPYHTHIQRYLSGYNLIESFYMSHRLMPWMNLVAGDPLMQPFVQRPEVKEVGFRKGEQGYSWQVSAAATAQAATIAELRCYVDGKLIQTIKAASGVFELAGFDPAVNRAAVIAIDSTPVKAQGRLLRTPARVRAKASAITFVGMVGGKARFSLGAACQFRWYAPRAKRRYGSGQGATLDLELSGSDRSQRNTVEIWCETQDKEPQAKHFDLDTAVVQGAMTAAKNAMAASNYAEALKAIHVLEGQQLDAIGRASVDDWKNKIEQKAKAQWQAIETKLPKVLRPQHIEQLRSFAKTFAGLPLARRAEDRLKSELSELDARAKPMLDQANKALERKKWSEALNLFKALVRKYPGSNHAVSARQKISEISNSAEAKGALEAGKRSAAAERLWKMAENYRRNGNASLRDDTLRKLIKRYPGTDASKRAKDALEGR